MTLVGFAVVMAGCGQAGAASSGAAVSLKTPSASPSPTPTPPTQPRPPDPPACSRTAPVAGCEVLYDPRGAPASCPVSPGVFIHPPRQAGNKFPNYGLGHGPVYFTGQVSWFAGSQEGEFLIDSAYTGPVAISAQLNGSAASPTFGGDRQLQIPAGSSGSFWRSWSGQVSFADAGCYTLTISGTGIADRVVIYVHAGSPPPG